MEYRTLENTDSVCIYEAFTQAFSDYQVSVDMPFKSFETMLKRNGFMPAVSVGAFADRTLVGFILNGVRDWDNEKTVYDLGTGVIPDFRRTGIMGELLNLVTRVLVPEGIGDVITGMDGAVPYYVSLVFPKFIAAVFLVVIMAAMMSTVDGVLLYVSSILGCTLYKNTIVPARRAKGIQIDDAKVEKTTMNILKYSTFVIGLIAVPIAFNKPANLTAMLWGAAGPIMSAVAGPVVIGIFSKRPSAKAAALGSVLGCASFLILYFAKIIGSVYLCCSIGGVVSILFCVIGMYVFPPMDEKLAADAFKTLED